MIEQRSAFVISRIATEGTDDFNHYRAILDEVIRPVLESHGFQVVRADDIHRAGSITQHIVEQLWQAQIVIADLTDLNPNVFYELGVRHSLRRRGTLLIQDTVRTPDIPFDLSAYRVIKFKGELTGIGQLKQHLTSFVTNFLGNEQDETDSPVHGWFPSLPADVVTSSRQSPEGSLQEEIAELRGRLLYYERTFGPSSDSHTTGSSPSSIVMEALADAKDGRLRSDLLEKAEEAVRRNDHIEFLTVVQRVLDTRGYDFTASDFRRLASQASHLDLDRVGHAIYEHSVNLYPNNSGLRQAHLRFLAHSNDPKANQLARTEMLKMLGVTMDETGVTLPEELGTDELSDLGVMLDAFHRDNLHEAALKITSALIDRFPNFSAVARNHARALMRCKREEEALTWHRQAVLCPDRDETSAYWYGNVLHDKKRHVDSAEAYCLGALLDLNDASGFAQLADEIFHAMRSRLDITTLQVARPSLPPDIDLSTMARCLKAAVSCNWFPQDQREACNRLAADIGVDIDELSKSKMTMDERFILAQSVYNLLRSQVTEDAPMGSTKSQFGSSEADVDK